MGIPRKRCYLLGPPLTRGRLRSAWLLLPDRLKPPPVALQVLPLGVNAILRWDRLHLSLSVHCLSLNTWFYFQARAEKDYLLGVVLVQDNPYKKLTMNQANWIRSELLKHLEAIIDQHDTVIPRFYEGGLKHGRYHLSCYDAYSCTWVERVENSLELTDANTHSRLQLVKPSQISQLQRAQVYISGPPLGVPRFIKLLTAQNCGLHTERWVVIHQQTTAHGQLLIRGIDHKSAAAIEAANFQLFCGISHVTFRLSRGNSRRAANT